MNFRDFLNLESSLNPMGGPTSGGSTGMDFWSGKNANLSVGNSFQSTGPVSSVGAYHQQKAKVIPPGPFSMVVGKSGPDANKGGAFSRTQENPITRPGSSISPRGSKSQWQSPTASPFSLGKQVTSLSPGMRQK